MRALEIWEANPKLSYADALCGVHSEFDKHELATFDRELAALPNIKPFQW
jgi:hypothetical protein